MNKGFSSWLWLLSPTQLRNCTAKREGREPSRYWPRLEILEDREVLSGFGIGLLELSVPLDNPYGRVAIFRHNPAATDDIKVCVLDGLWNSSGGPTVSACYRLGTIELRHSRTSSGSHLHFEIRSLSTRGDGWELPFLSIVAMAAAFPARRQIHLPDEAESDDDKHMNGHGRLPHNSRDENHPSPDWRLNVGSTIRDLRLSCGLTQQQVTERANITINFLSGLENGRREVSFKILRTIADVLQVPMPWILILATQATEADPKLQSLRLLRRLQDTFRERVKSNARAPKHAKASR